MNRLLVFALLASLPLAAHPRPWRHRQRHPRPVVILPPGPVCLPRPLLPRLHPRRILPRHRHWR